MNECGMYQSGWQIWMQVNDSLYIQWEYGLVPRLLLLVINLVGAIFTDPALGWLSTLDERTSEH